MGKRIIGRATAATLLSALLALSGCARDGETEPVSDRPPNTGAGLHGIPEDACDLADDPAVRRALVAALDDEPSKCTPLDKGADGETPWGATFGTYDAYLAVQEIDASTLRSLTSADLDQREVTTAGIEATLVTNRPASAAHGVKPRIVAFLGSRTVLIESVPDRAESGPELDDDAQAHELAVLAALAKLVGA